MSIQQKSAAYISGALTGVEDPVSIKAFYEAIGSLCRDFGLQAYVPHLNTDPIANPDLSPQKVFEIDKYQVTNSDLIVAYIGCPSIGVGMEIAYADVAKIPIILLYEVDRSVSRFPRGVPNAIAEIQFLSYDDALQKLKSVLEREVDRSI